MAKVASTPKAKSNAVKARKAKTADTIKTSHLSAEVVDDSDMEEDSNTPPPTTINISTPISNGTKSARTSRNVAAASAGGDSSEEDDTSDEDGMEVTESPIPSPKPVNSTNGNGLKRKSTSTEDSDSESEEVSGSDEEAHKNKKARVEINTEDDIDSSDEEEVDPSVEEQDSSEEEQQNTDAPQQSAEPSKAPLKHSSLLAIPTQVYQPPIGYSPVNCSNAAIVSSSDFTDKVVWHISAPVGLPLSSIKEIALSAVQAGEPILKHKDVNYILTEEALQDSSVLLPSKDGYTALKQPIHKSFNLRPAFTIPHIPARAAARNEGSLAAANIATAAVTAIRPQPKGLKMRYKPPAFGSGGAGLIGSSDEEEEEDEGPIFQFPRAVGPSTDGNVVKVGDGVTKKKHKKQSGLEHAHNDLDKHVEPQAKAKKTPRLLDTRAEGDTVNADEARRKAEKKAKKAAKRKAAETSL